MYGYVQRIERMFYRFAWMYSRWVERQTAVQNVDEITKLFSEAEDISTSELTDDWKELSIENLSFSYHAEDNKELHLDKINLKIRKGEKIAFIGDSGSGKTTMLKVMRALYEPRHLHLNLDGKELEHGFKSISDAVALIPQDPELFATTIKENITMGVSYDLAEVRKYTNMAEFTSVIKRLPKKWNSNIVERGVNLSGGEKQRLALSRGLLASEDKQILLLDEPTSSVDSRNEMQIYDNIFMKFKDKAIISSIHRLHLLSKFDMVYFFKDGKIIAEGSFYSLLKTSPEFKSLWEKYNKTRALEA